MYIHILYYDFFVSDKHFFRFGYLKNITMECLKNLKEHLIAFESKVEEILNYVTEEPPEIVIENLRNHVVFQT